MGGGGGARSYRRSTDFICSRHANQTLGNQLGQVSHIIVLKSGKLND